MTKSTIEEWLVTYLTRKLGRKEGEITSSLNFSDLGLDSAAAVEMLGDLEEWLGADDLDPTLPYEHPTIAELAAHLGDDQ